MSHSGIPVIMDVGKAVGKVLKPVFSPKLPGPDSLPVRGDVDPEIAQRASEQFATREQTIKRASVAAGATRSANDADVLGYAGVKPRAAARVLLGGR